jgi:type IV secretory pathway VirB9-like protein
MRGVVIALLLVGCSSGPVVRVESPLRPDVRLMPDPDPGPNLIRETDAVHAVDRAQRKLDEAVAGKKAEDGAQELDARAVIREGQISGTEDVIEGDCPGGVCLYDYQHGRGYAIHTCYEEDTLLELAPGEKVNDDRARGDTASPTRCAFPLARGWCAALTKSGNAKGAIVENLIIWQTTRTPATKRAWVATNYGLYRFELHAATPGEERCMSHVRFYHRDMETRRLMDRAERTGERDESGAADDGPAALSSQYTIEVLEGSPSWVPTAVVARMQGDRAEVAIQFPRGVQWSAKPVIKTDGSAANDCSWIVETNAYVCQNLFHLAIIQMGSAETGYEKVRIRKAKE